LLSVAAAPQDHRIEYRTAYSVSQLRNEENQLQGTSGLEVTDTLPQSGNGPSVSSAKELGLYGMSTPSYETLESQLQSPQLPIRQKI